jgi:hypothetical protein
MERVNGFSCYLRALLGVYEQWHWCVLLVVAVVGLLRVVLALKFATSNYSVHNVCCWFVHRSMNVARTIGRDRHAYARGRHACGGRLELRTCIVSVVRTNTFSCLGATDLCLARLLQSCSARSAHPTHKPEWATGCSPLLEQAAGMALTMPTAKVLAKDQSTWVAAAAPAAEFCRWPQPAQL